MNVFQFLIDNIFLVTLALVSGGMLLWPLVRQSGNALTPAQATHLINREDALMLDVRDAGAFQQGHIVNARNIPAAQLKERLVELNKFKTKGKPVIVHCDTGSRSSSGAALLTKQGFEKVFTLAGGIAAWRAAGLPTEK